MSEEKISVSKIRTLVAEYIQSEGCSCCENIEKHQADQERLAEALGVEMYDDKSGWNFRKYITEVEK